MCLSFAIFATAGFALLVSIAFVTVYERDEISFVTIGDWGELVVAPYAVL
jgi:hypothetical protein